MHGHIRVWVTDTKDYVIPEDIFQATKWRKDGWPDGRSRNFVFYQWLHNLTN